MWTLALITATVTGLSLGIAFTTLAFILRNIKMAPRHIIGLGIFFGLLIRDLLAFPLFKYHGDSLQDIGYDVLLIFSAIMFLKRKNNIVFTMLAPWIIPGWVAIRYYIRSFDMMYVPIRIELWYYLIVAVIFTVLFVLRRNWYYLLAFMGSLSYITDVREFVWVVQGSWSQWIIHTKYEAWLLVPLFFPEVLRGRKMILLAIPFILASNLAEYISTTYGFHFAPGHPLLDALIIRSFIIPGVLLMFRF